MHLPFYWAVIFYIIFISMNLLPRMNAMLDFICRSSVELQRTQSKRKNTNWIILFNTEIRIYNIEIYSENHFAVS